MKINKFYTIFIIALIALIGNIPAQATSLSDYMENKLADVVFRATAFSETSPTTYYVALYTTSCSDSAGGTEVTGGSYARVGITRSLASWKGTHASVTGVSSGTGGTVSNAGAVTYPAATADWGTVGYWALIDTASGAGNLIVCAALTASRNITNGSTPSFAIDALTVQVDN